MTQALTLSQTRFVQALPFAISLCAPFVLILATTQGGAWLLLPPLCTRGLFAVLDAAFGLNKENPNVDTPLPELFWYRALTVVWFPVQFALLIWMLAYVPFAAHLGLGEKIAAFFGMGVVSGSIGIVYSHELIHQKGALERWMGDLLLASVLYSHFRSEHLRMHHIHVATPQDPASARYNEGFHRFFPRVLVQSIASAWSAETAMLKRRGQRALHRDNPYWRYGALQLAMLAIATAVGGTLGLMLFVIQAFTAIWQLELTNYIEHYGLTRRRLEGGKYEHVLPRHSWNASHRASNWLLINLQRHSDHHYKPDRRYPLLQTYSDTDAPALPFGYPVMTLLAMLPPLWKFVMNHRMLAWRRQFYPDITQWHAYNKGLDPLLTQDGK